MKPISKTHKQASSFLKWGISIWVKLGGRKMNIKDAAWVLGPMGFDEIIGDEFYKKYAVQHDMRMEEDNWDNGLMSDFTRLNGPDFDAALVHKTVADFYEHTSRYTMDIWNNWKWPLRIFAKTLIRIVSRDMQQFNLPLTPEEASKGMTSEVIKLYDRKTNQHLYSCWLRKTDEGNIIYSGFYSVMKIPGKEGSYVKVVFPVPNGCTSVILKPVAMPDGSFLLNSSGNKFGDPGAYRIHRLNDDTVIVKRFQLKETLHVYIDSKNILRTDHDFSYIGLPMLHLHYKILTKAESDLN